MEMDTLFERATENSISLDNLIDKVSGATPVNIQPEGQTFEHPQPEQQAQQQPDGLNAGDFVNAEMAVAIFDIAVVNIGYYALREAGVKMAKSELKASQQEKQALEQPMSAMLAEMNIKITNPFQAFAVAAVFIYGGKIIGPILGKVMDGEGEEEAVNESGTDLNKLVAPRKRKPGGGRKKKAANDTANG